MIIVNRWKPSTIITKSSTLDAAAVLDRPLISLVEVIQGRFPGRGFLWKFPLWYL